MINDLNIILKKTDHEKYIIYMKSDKKQNSQNDSENKITYKSL